LEKRKNPSISPQKLPASAWKNTTGITEHFQNGGKLGGKSGKHCGKPRFFFTNPVENPVEKVKR
jgi:hypothetical protein